TSTRSTRLRANIERSQRPAKRVWWRCHSCNSGLDSATRCFETRKASRKSVHSREGAASRSPAAPATEASITRTRPRDLAMLGAEQSLTCRIEIALLGTQLDIVKVRRPIAKRAGLVQVARPDSGAAVRLLPEPVKLDFVRFEMALCHQGLNAEE